MKKQELKITLELEKSILESSIKKKISLPPNIK